MSIKKFKDVTYDLSTTEGYLCNTITPVTASTGETVSAIEVFNDVIVNPSEPARPLTSDNMNSTIDDITAEFVEANNQLNNKVPKSTTVNGRALSSNIVILPGDLGAEPTFSKNTAFNKNFGMSVATVCQGNDGRLFNSRKCNNTFDDLVAAKANLNLHKVATSGKFTDLSDISEKNILDFYRTMAGFSNMTRLSESTTHKVIDYKTKCCFYSSGYYDSGAIVCENSGVWQGNEPSYINNCIIVPEFMGGSYKRFHFILPNGHYVLIPSSDVIVLELTLAKHYLYSETILFNV